MVADPQIEGDGRIMREGVLGKIDLFFNDVYFHLIARALSSLKPDHGIILGDLFSSEYIGSEEFKLRTERLRWSFSPLFKSIPVINITG